MVKSLMLLTATAGDSDSSGGGCQVAVTTRIRCAWGKFRELLLLLTCRSLSFITRGRMFDIYIRKVMLHASECWALTSVDHARLQRTDRSMIRWICNVKWEDNRSSKSLLEQLQIPSITSVLSCNRLRCYGHVDETLAVSTIHCTWKFRELSHRVALRRLGFRLSRKI